MKKITCTSCGIEKDETMFHRDKKRSDGYRHTCKECRSEELSIYYISKKNIKIERFCEECNASIGYAHGLTKYCISCRDMKDRAYARKYRNSNKDVKTVKTISTKKMIIKKIPRPIFIDRGLVKSTIIDRINMKLEKSWEILRQNKLKDMK